MSNSASERIVIIASADATLRQRLQISLTSMRWQVLEANGGAEAMACLEEQYAEALLLDAWLPDLEVGAFSEVVSQLYPNTDLLRFDGKAAGGIFRSARRHELLQALREVNHEPGLSGALTPKTVVAMNAEQIDLKNQVSNIEHQNLFIYSELSQRPGVTQDELASVSPPIPGMVGHGAAMRELVTLIRLVAPHTVRVLIEGETGTGKELVAKALHALSARAKKPFVVLNCAAIPEALLEAELFGHTRGAFTGAVQSRIGRIEAAHGGTLFLDEIGEMPIALQAKLLRFLENGELQRIGDNESVRVDVRVISATHQDLDKCVTEGSFRLDLLHRLAVFPIEVPRLSDRLEDLPYLVEHFLSELAREIPRKKLTPGALESLYLHTWPGNIRELGHVLQRAVILAGSRSEIMPADIRVRRSQRI